MSPTDHIPDPSIVLEARENFAAWFDREKPTGAELFDYLTKGNYLTFKAFVELSTGYDA